MVSNVYETYYTIFHFPRQPTKVNFLSFFPSPKNPPRPPPLIVVMAKLSLATSPLVLCPKRKLWVILYSIVIGTEPTFLIVAIP